MTDLLTQPLLSVTSCRYGDCVEGDPLGKRADLLSVVEPRFFVPLGSSRGPITGVSLSLDDKRTQQMSMALLASVICERTSFEEVPDLSRLGLQRLTNIDFSPYKHCDDMSFLQVVSRLCLKVEQLRVSWCHLQDRDIAGFSNLKVALFPDCCRLTNRGVAYFIANNTKLEVLDLSHHHGKQRDLSLPRGCPNRRSYGRLVSCSGKVANDTLGVIGRHLKELRELYFAGRDSVKNDGVKQLAEGCPRLQVVDFNGCFKVGDDAVLALARYCRDLQVVRFRGCENLTDDAVIALARACPGLLEIDFSRCPKLTNRAVYAIIEHCKGLQKLNVGSCSLITLEWLGDLSAGCKGLRELNVDGCRRIGY